jgi:hypothetical protein
VTLVGGVYQLSSPVGLVRGDPDGAALDLLLTGLEVANAEDELPLVQCLGFSW